MKLLGITENKTTKGKNGQDIPHLESIKVVLVHCSIVNNGNEYFFLIAQNVKLFG